MVGNDDKFGDEINRIEELEQVVQRFKFITSGDGKVLGGFGKLFKPPEGLSLEQRLANLENATNAFNVIGQNVNVDGNFDDGFILS